MCMREERLIIITKTPDELRALADKMDKTYAKASAGSTTFVDFLGYRPDLKVCLHYDKYWFEQKEKVARDKILGVKNAK